MKIFFITLCLLATIVSCQRKVTRDDTEKQIKKTFHNFLMKGKDSTKISFEILKVIYYEDSTFYDCNFNVRMIQGSKDTVGVMRAKISKDFETVRRRE